MEFTHAVNVRDIRNIVGTFLQYREVVLYQDILQCDIIQDEPSIDENYINTIGCICILKEDPLTILHAGVDEIRITQSIFTLTPYEIFSFVIRNNIQVVFILCYLCKRYINLCYNRDWGIHTIQVYKLLQDDSYYLCTCYIQCTKISKVRVRVVDVFTHAIFQKHNTLLKQLN